MDGWMDGWSYLEEAGGLSGWKEAVLLEQLHDQLPPLIQDPPQ